MQKELKKKKMPLGFCPSGEGSINYSSLIVGRSLQLIAEKFAYTTVTYSPTH